jgi:hypothetical protein
MTTGHLPVWHEASGRYLDPATGEFLPTWDEALDTIGGDDQPLHVARFGPKFDAQGVLAGSRDSARCIGYLTKYLANCHQTATDVQQAHAGRLACRFNAVEMRQTLWRSLIMAMIKPYTDPGFRVSSCAGVF